jgi:hypothetical protein
MFAGLQLIFVLFFQIGYPTSGGGLGSPTYSANFGLPFTFAYVHTVEAAGSYTDPFVLLPLNLGMDFIIWCAPWFLFLGLLKLSSTQEQRKLTHFRENPHSTSSGK